MTLRSKIVALVIGLTVALVAGLWLLLSRSWSDWAGDVVDRDLVARAEAIRAVIEVKKDGRLDFEDEHAPALSDPNHPFRVLGPGGYAVTRGDLAWPALPDPATVRPQTLTSSGPDGTRWRILSQWMPLTHDKRPGRPEPLRAAIQVAGPAEPYTGLEERFRHGLLLGVLGALFIGGIGGTVLVHLSLAPLRRLTTEIDQIGATSLQRRVGVERLDRELATLAKAFNDLLGRLDDAMQVQRQFVSRASHSLRTPISTILTRAEVALRRDRESAAYREALTDVAATARDSAALVDNLLMLTRFDERQAVLRRESVPIAEIARDVERLVEPHADAAGVALEVDVPEDLVAVGERVAVRELLAALVENAVRYTPRGGRAGVRGRHAADGCSVEVWDTGPGIPLEERDRVFDRFHRGNSAEATGTPGCGLGLSIVKAIADAHGATIRLDDRPGGGLQVVVTLPAGDSFAGRDVRRKVPDVPRW